MKNELESSNEFVISDEVWHRVVQIVQEAMLMGVDCADLLRQIRVNEGHSGELTLTPEYNNMIREHHKQLIKEASDLEMAKNANKIITGN